MCYAMAFLVSFYVLNQFLGSLFILHDFIFLTCFMTNPPNGTLGRGVWGEYFRHVYKVFWYLYVIKFKLIVFSVVNLQSYRVTELQSYRGRKLPCREFFVVLNNVLLTPP